MGEQEKQTFIEHRMRMEKMASTFQKKASYTRDGVEYGVSLSKDDEGHYVKTHRARSKSYPTPEAIPVKDLKFIDSTG